MNLGLLLVSLGLAAGQVPATAEPVGTAMVIFESDTEVEPCLSVTDQACAVPACPAPVCAAPACTVPVCTEPVCAGAGPVESSCCGANDGFDEAGYYRSRWGAGAGCGPEDYVCSLFCKPCRQSCFLSTGDLYPHYPYLPEAGGYYYFRPYNYTHIAQHQQAAALWGAPAGNPYSHALYERLNTVQLDQPAVTRTRLPTRGDRLPNLNDLLDRPAEEE